MITATKMTAVATHRSESAVIEDALRSFLGEGQSAASMSTVAMHRMGLFSRQAALRRCLTEKAEGGKREVRPTAPDAGCPRRRGFLADRRAEAILIGGPFQRRARTNGYYYPNA